jgi:prefoldin subunit 2
MTVTAPTAATTTTTPAGADASPAPVFKTERDVLNYWETLSQEVNLARGKIGELAVSLREHVNVLENVKNLDPNRRCFRSVGGVLVERTVKEVIPAVESNAANLRRAIEAIKEQCAVKEAELEALRKKYKIRVQGEDANAATAAPAGETSNGGGVLA